MARANLLGCVYPLTVTRSLAPFWLMLLVASASGGACTTNHDALAKQNRGGGGQGGKAGAASAGLGNTGNFSPEGGAPQNPDDEQPGEDVVTIVNGVVDAPSVQLCFARTDIVGGVPELVGEPSSELSYGSARIFTEIPGVSLQEDAIQPWLLAGTLSLVEGLDCVAAVELALEEEAKVTPVEEQGTGGVGAGGEPAGAGGAGEPSPRLELPKLRARAMPALPAGSFAVGRSVLLVLSGCIGGAAFTDSLETSVCGEAYSAKTPTLQPVVVKLSRESRFDKVGLQAVQGSLAAGVEEMRAASDVGSLALTFASKLTFGAIQPRPADVRFGSAELGVGVPGHGVQAIGEGVVLYQEGWASLRDRAGISEVVNGRSYSLVLVGPSPQVAKPGFWSSPSLVLVDNDPTRE